MDRTQLARLLADIAAGAVTPEEGLQRLRFWPYEDLGFARIDHHRHLRQGVPEVIYCQGKTVAQVRAIGERILREHGELLATRVAPEAAQALLELAPQAEYNPVARTVVVRRQPRPSTQGVVLVISAGTADLPVAEEAAVTARAFGSTVQTVYDVGVAGLHRLLDVREQLLAARVIVVVAGMEGALASVVGGMVAQPVIAVPTSVGYGAHFSGLAPLLTMLNSCAAGVAVVNIDNGFGAGYLAHKINLIGER
ncbi:MAG: 1-(5-phosphoribosyl)-5-amino-4-imidazole-carboxylate carboxylase [Candidatus Tectimicrobiota bacterium]|nr:MAG: 1-(5-phosphoribosyl)-5-amino-4-imidazole-carboxylate carboxylase [Candidatus Tectomicrobia bacterium]